MEVLLISPVGFYKPLSDRAFWLPSSKVYVKTLHCSIMLHGRHGHLKYPQMLLYIYMQLVDKGQSKGCTFLIVTSGSNQGVSYQTSTGSNPRYDSFTRPTTSTLSRWPLSGSSSSSRVR